MGRPAVVSDETGAVVSKVDYYPFGENMSLTGDPGRFIFNGKEYDDAYDFNLYYYGARYMDPALGRFITPDPVKDFINPYSYVGNNPLNRIDPTGMRGLPPPPLLTGILPFSYETLHRIDIVEAVKMQAEAAAKQKKADYIRRLMEDAAEAAEAMKETTWNKQFQEEWQAIADVLRDWASMSDEAILGSITKLEGDLEAILIPDWNNETGELRSTKLLLNETVFLGGSYSRTDLIGILIHEATHKVFLNRFPNKYTKFTKNGLDYDYNWMNEEFAYKRQFDFISHPNNINNIKHLTLEAETWIGNNNKLKRAMLNSHIQHSLIAAFYYYWP